VSDAVRVRLDRFVFNPLGSETLDKRLKPDDGKGDPACARMCGVRLDEERRVLVDLPQHLVPDPMVWGSPEEPGVYQSMLTSRSDTGTPAKRSVISLISWRWSRSRTDDRPAAGAS
jgi:hypothetical protein